MVDRRGESHVSCGWMIGPPSHCICTNLTNVKVRLGLCIGVSFAPTPYWWQSVPFDSFVVLLGTQRLGLINRTRITVRSHGSIRSYLLDRLDDSQKQQKSEIVALGAAIPWSLYFIDTHVTLYRSHGTPTVVQYAGLQYCTVAFVRYR